MIDNTVYFGRLKVNYDKRREGFEIYRKELDDATGEFHCIAYNEIALGQHFLDFLENNRYSLPSVIERYKEIYRYMDKDILNKDMVSKTMDFVLGIYADLSDLHVFWKTVLYENEVLKNYRWFCFYQQRMYLKDDSAELSEAARYGKMCEYWEKIRRGILQEIPLLEEFKAFVDSMMNAVSFCLDDTKFPEFLELHSRQRASIYQMTFDRNFMKGLPVQTTYKLAPRRKEFTNYTGHPTNHTKDKMLLQGSILSNANYYELMNSGNATMDFNPYIEAVKNNSVEVTTNLDLVEMEDIFTVCMYSFSSLISQNVHVRPCRNCGKFFAPYNRSDEIYCARLQENKKSCKDNYYEKQLEKDELTQYYRAVYKKNNAYKQRNLSNKPSVEQEFKLWAKEAKQALKLAKEGKISEEEFRMILDEKKPRGAYPEFF